jgi:hypothetical protein
MITIHPTAGGSKSFKSLRSAEDYPNIDSSEVEKEDQPAVWQLPWGFAWFESSDNLIVIPFSGVMSMHWDLADGS